MQIAKWYLRYFFLNENQHCRATNKINNQNKYLSPTVNNHHGDQYPKRWPILLSRVDRVLCRIIFYRPTKSADFARQTTHFCCPILLADKISQLCRSSDVPFRLRSHRHEWQYQSESLVQASPAHIYGYSRLALVSMWMHPKTPQATTGADWKLFRAGCSKHRLELTMRLTRGISPVNSRRVVPRQNPRVKTRARLTRELKLTSG